VWVENDILDAGDQEELEAQCGFVDAGLGLQLEIYAVPEVVVGLGVAARRRSRIRW
jgi:hypothetical protein